VYSGTSSSASIASFGVPALRVWMTNVDSSGAFVKTKALGYVEAGSDVSKCRSPAWVEVMKAPDRFNGDHRDGGPSEVI